MTSHTAPIDETLTIRRAASDDAEVVQTLLIELATHEGDAEHVTVTADDWREQLSDPDVIVYVAWLGDTPAGYVSATRRRYLWGGGWMIGLDDAYVRAGARNHGVGQRLMGAMAGFAAPEQLIVRWEMKTTNTDAQRFYARLGASLHTKVIAGWGPAGYADHARAVAGVLEGSHSRA